MAELPTAPVNTAAIAQAIAQATNYVIPSVDEIFAAGLTFDQVNQSQWFNGFDISPGAILPASFDGLYYNLSYLWPQLNTTGIIVNTTEYVSRAWCLISASNAYSASPKCAACYSAIFFTFRISLPMSFSQPSLVLL
jgi:hypothetical protein